MGKGKRNRQQRAKSTHKSPLAASVAGFDVAAVLSAALADTGDTPNTIPALPIRFLLDVANNVWRLKRKMMDVSTGEAKPEYRSVFRHVEALLDLLAAQNIEIRDHEGERYDTGNAVDVVTSEPRLDLKREEIIETIKPTIRFQGSIAQRGEVVVGVPETKATSAE